MKAFLIFFALLFFGVGCSAEPRKEPENIPASAPYVFNEADFINRYEEARRRINNGEVPEKSAPLSTSESGFAIIPLIKETYGIEAFAVLPVMNRGLTDEEMLQLAYGMGGVPSSEILSEKNSWYKPYEGDEGLSFSNRAMTFGERNNHDIAVSLYYNEGKRANAELSNNPLDGGPICVDIPELQVNGGTTLFWIYPASTMTEEHFLQMIPLRYKHVTEEHYTPLGDQIQYTHALELADQYALDYQMNDRVPDGKFAFYSLRRNSGGPIEHSDAWTVWLIYENDYHFILEIDANDGAFFFIQRQPVDFFTSAQMPSRSDITAQRTDEEIIEAVNLYTEAFKNRGMKINEIKILGDAQTYFFGEAKKTEVTVLSNTPDLETYKYEIEVIKENLLINRVTLKS